MFKGPPRQTSRVAACLLRVNVAPGASLTLTIVLLQDAREQPADAPPGQPLRQLPQPLQDVSIPAVVWAPPGSLPPLPLCCVGSLACPRDLRCPSVCLSRSVSVCVRLFSSRVRSSCLGTEFLPGVLSLSDWKV